MQPKLEPCIYLGHDERTNVASVYSLRKRKILCTRDVTFRSGDFSYGQAVLKGDAAIQLAIDEDAQMDYSPQPTYVENAQPESVDDIGHSTVRSTRWGNSKSSLHSSASDSESESEHEEERYAIEAIKGQRMIDGRREYLCKWIGYDEETWEPDDMLKVDVPELIGKFNASQPAPRRSPRLHPHITDRRSSNVDHSEFDLNDEESSTPRVHMAMSAMMTMQPHSERMSESDYAELVNDDLG